MEQNKLSIAVIIPSYNVAPYIEEAIQSVLEQPYPYITIVCVNDGSTDDTQSILMELSSKSGGRVVVIDQQNGGVSAARNAGIEYVLNNLKTNYIMFLDGDDAWCRDWLSDDIVSILHDDHDVVTFDACYADQKLKYRSSYSKAFVGTVEGGDKAVNIDHSMWQGTAFKTSFIGNTDIRFHIGQKYGEDLCFLLEARSLAKTCTFSKCLMYLYRDRPGSAVRQTISAIKYYTTLFDGWIQSHTFLREHGFESKCTYGAIKWYLNDLVQAHYRQHGSRIELELALQKYSDCLDVDGPEDEKAHLWLEQFSKSYELKQRIIGSFVKVASIRNSIPLLRRIKDKRRYPIPIEG